MSTWKLFSLGLKTDKNGYSHLQDINHNAYARIFQMRKKNLSDMKTICIWKPHRWNKNIWTSVTNNMSTTYNIAAANLYSYETLDAWQKINIKVTRKAKAALFALETVSLRNHVRRKGIFAENFEEISVLFINLKTWLNNDWLNKAS